MVAERRVLTPPMVVIVGETASGKSALAMELAHRFGGELICADAMTVYPGFDVGTAKPSANDQAKIPHHVLDVANPITGFSAAEFKRLALGSVADISSRNKLPIIVGGSGLYVDGVLYDYQFKDISNRYERDVLNTMTISELIATARERKLDVRLVDNKNPRRLVRFIETEGKSSLRSGLRPQTCVIGLRVDRKELLHRIERRVDSMLQRGLEQEVRQLADRYGWDSEAMNSVGYREWRSYFEGDDSREEVRHKIVVSTVRLAKKQRTWFRRNNSIQWVDYPSEAVDITTAFLNN